MTNLVSAYQKKEIREFEKILKGRSSPCSETKSPPSQTHKIFVENHNAIMGDSFIRTYIDDVLKNIRTQVLIRLIKPYTRIEIPFISRVSRQSSLCLVQNFGSARPILITVLQQLNIPVEDVEELLVTLILDKKISGRIDQVQQRLEIQQK